MNSVRIKDEKFKAKIRKHFPRLDPDQPMSKQEYLALKNVIAKKENPRWQKKF